MLGSELSLLGNGFPIEMSATHGRIAILFLIAVAAIIVMLCSGPIPQDPAYHRFADNREFGGLRNFWDVLSSLPFLAVGLYGFRRRRFLANSRAVTAYTVLCLGAMLIGLGSAYYHYAPATSSLFLDRLAMTVAFMAMFSLLLEERVIPEAAARTLWPLLAIGIGSVTYWYWSESQGSGDLRAYALVQYLPMLLLPLILLLFRGGYLSSPLLWSALALYFLAKVFENFDHQVFVATRMFSGHTLKHLLASLAVLCIVLAVPAGRDGR